MNQDLLYKTEVYSIIGACMEVHKHLGHGFLEIVYKDALQLELKSKNIKFSREKKYEIVYKNELLPHFYVSDFVVFDKIIVEVKCVKKLKAIHIAQSINYLKASGNRIAVLINFSRGKLEYKRIIF